MWFQTRDFPPADTDVPPVFSISDSLNVNWCLFRAKDGQKSFQTSAKITCGLHFSRMQAVYKGEHKMYVVFLV